MSVNILLTEGSKCRNVRQKYHFLRGQLSGTGGQLFRNGGAINFGIYTIQSIEEVLIDASEILKVQYSEWIVNVEKEKNERIRNYILYPDKPHLA